MTSTTLDAALCLLLVSAAAGTLATSAPATAPPDRADALAETLATSTAEVNYTLAPGARRPAAPVEFPTTDGPEFARVSHGTFAALVAEAALGNATVSGSELTHTSDDFEREVRQAVLTAFASSDVQIVAVWRPYPGSHLDARFAVGPSPPPGSDVHAATLSVPSGFAPAREDALAAARSRGFEGVARVVATRLVAGLFPPTQTRLALGDDYPVAPLVTARYRRLATDYGADVTAAVEARNVAVANGRLAVAMAPTVERDLRHEFETPTAAARGVRLTAVRLVVRTW